MDMDKALQNDPGEEYRGFRMRCVKTARLKDNLILYVADAAAETVEAERLLGPHVVRVREQSWAHSEEQARQEWFVGTRRIIDELYARQ